jgi:hypothetical protein
VQLTGLLASDDLQIRLFSGVIDASLWHISEE